MRLVKAGASTLAAGVAVYLVAAYLGARTPRSAVFHPDSNKEPVQTAPVKKQFTVERDNHRYDVTPVHQYEIQGLVVTGHDSDGFADISHSKWGDFLNTKDICVVWGTNLNTQMLSRLKFWSGNWTCYVQSRDWDTWKKFNTEKLSNNHLLPADEPIAAKLRDARIGDEIRITGHLVNYRIDGGPERRSSTIRTDGGNGACEILYVESFQTLKRHNKIWIGLRKLGFWAGAIGALILAFGLFVAPFMSYSRRNPS